MFPIVSLSDESDESDAYPRLSSFSPRNERSSTCLFFCGVAPGVFDSKKKSLYLGNSRISYVCAPTSLSVMNACSNAGTPSKVRSFRKQGRVVKQGAHALNVFQNVVNTL